MADLYSEVNKTINPFGYKIDKASIKGGEVIFTIKRFSNICECCLPNGAIKRRISK